MAVIPVPEALEELGLVYLPDSVPGIQRKRSGKGFAYYSPNGTLLRDPKDLKRIKSLAIPPAYRDVWISPKPNGHLQATGFDARGRKQYRYHPKWMEMSAESKFERMLAFGKALPTLRGRIESDLRRSGLPPEKVLATVVWFLENSLIRVGNREYAEQNKSFGLTTMRARYCRVEGTNIEFRFVGKRGIKHTISVSDRRMARTVKKLQELPGQELFQYLDDEGSRHAVTSQDVNNYIREITGESFTAKDFRTWAATVLAFECLAGQCEFESVREAKRRVSAMLEEVSSQLGNTPAICRKSYVHPAIVQSFLEGSLAPFLAGPCAELGAPDGVLKFLEQSTRSD